MRLREEGENSCVGGLGVQLERMELAWRVDVGIWRDGMRNEYSDGGSHMARLMCKGGGGVMSQSAKFQVEADRQILTCSFQNKTRCINFQDISQACP